MSPVEAGGLVGLIALIGVFGAIIGGTAGDRYPKRVGMSIIVSIEVVALGLVLTGVHASLYVFILGFGFGQGAHAINRAILGEYFGHSHYARLWGIIGMAAAPMAVVGPIFTGWLSETSGSYLGVIRIFVFLGNFCNFNLASLFSSGVLFESDKIFFKRRLFAAKRSTVFFLFNSLSTNALRVIFSNLLFDWKIKGLQ